jgi:multiple sugar transport system permease protein
LRTRLVEYIGFANFEKLLSTPVFWKILTQSLVFLVATVGVQLVVGFLVALLLDRCKWGRGFTGALLLIPWVSLFVVVAIVFSFLLHPLYGPLTSVFSALGLETFALNLMRDPARAMVVIILINAWKFFPFIALMVLAGLQAVGRDHLEAAIVDGAGYWQRVRYVIIPSLRPVLGSTLILASAWALNSFTLPWVMTGGGPQRGTELLTIYIYKTGFVSLDFGLASAASGVLFLLVVVVTLPYVLTLRRQR